MSMWWLEPGWKQTLCGRCGVNIWDSGGDPDHGVCHDCFFAERREPERRPACDICGLHEAVAGEGKYGVCSEECQHKAQDLLAAISPAGPLERGK